MLVELIKDKELEFNLCLCSGRDYHVDIQALGQWITVDNKSAFGDGKSHIPESECVQFSFTYDEYIRNDHRKYYCPRCKTFPYRIIGELKRYKL